MYGESASQAPASRPLPQITPLNKPFWDNARNHVFSVQVCEDCGDAHVPEAPVCPNCLSRNQSWMPVSGEATLESWVDFYRAYWPCFADSLPYRVCLVRLKEGPLFVSNLVGGDADLSIGTRLKVVFEPVSDDVVLPLFALAGD